MTTRLLNGAEAPFADVFAPAVAATGGLAPSAFRRAVDGHAASGLLRGVVNELGSLAAPTLLQQFSRMAHRTSLRVDSDGDVTAFSHWLTAGGLSMLVVDLPDLDAILHRQLSAAIARLRELVVRLEQSAPLLERALGFRLPVVDAVPLVSGAYLLTSGTGRRVVYKRRSLGMEAALAELLRHVNDRGWGPPLATAKVLDLGDHGFMEHVPAQRMSSAADVRLMCERFGMLLAIATMLGAADLHGRNIIVGSNGPVIIDAETVLRPPWSDRDDRDASVHASAILPMSGFVHRAGLLAAFVPPAESPWCDVGTDAVRIRPLIPALAAAQRVAEEHLRQLGADGARHVLLGFRWAYTGILAEGLPVEVFADTGPRVLLRPSGIYEDIMLSSLSPDVLAAPGRRTALLERSLAAAPHPVRHSHSLAESVRRAEVSSVDRFVFPRFTMPAAGGPLRIGDRVLGGAPFEPPLVRARRLVDASTRDSLERHAAEVAQQLGAFVDRGRPSSLAEVP